jgi:hypothetical protein
MFLQETLLKQHFKHHLKPMQKNIVVNIQPLKQGRKSVQKSVFK